MNLVHCLAYGEKDILLSNEVNEPSKNRGTHHFWKLLATCAYGADSAFTKNTTKGGEPDLNKRLINKLAVLEECKQKGIWLLDSFIFGWYIPQPQKYKRSTKSGEVHRMPKFRPPPKLKCASLVLSWEMYMKHVIREVVEAGNLKVLIPIGMEVQNYLTRKRLEETLDGKAELADAIPAPNSWATAGYDKFVVKLDNTLKEKLK